MKIKINAVIDQRKVYVSTGISNVSCKKMCVGRSIGVFFYLGVQMFCSETPSSSALSTYPACTSVQIHVHVHVYRRGSCLLLVSSSRRRHPTQLFVDRGAALPAPLQYVGPCGVWKLWKTFNHLTFELSMLCWSFYESLWVRVYYVAALTVISKNICMQNTPEVFLKDANEIKRQISNFHYKKHSLAYWGVSQL